MSTQRNIPQELHEQIVQYLSKRDLSEYRAVCKDWYTPAIKRAYDDISIRGVPQLEQLVDSLLLDSYLGSLVHTLELFIGHREHFDSSAIVDTLVNLVQFTPNLKSVKINGFGHIYLCRAINKAHETGCHWKHVQKVDFQNLNPVNFQNHDEYYEAIMALRHSLTEIGIMFSNDAVVQYRRMEGYLKFLAMKAEFKKVESLSVEMRTQFPSLGITDLDKFISGFPSLSSVRLLVHKLHLSSANLDAIEPSLNVTHVDVLTLWVTEVLLDYLRIKFPNAKSIKLAQTNSALPGAYHQETTSVRNFAAYLQRVDYFHLSLIKRSNRNDIVQLFTSVLGTESICISSSRTRVTSFIEKSTPINTTR